MFKNSIYSLNLGHSCLLADASILKSQNCIYINVDKSELWKNNFMYPILLHSRHKTIKNSERTLLFIQFNQNWNFLTILISLFLYYL